MKRDAQHVEQTRELLARIQAPDASPFVFAEPDGRKQFVSEADEDARFRELVD